MTTSAGIRELRAELAAAVRRAGAGETTLITVGGRPVAVLGPVAGTTPDHGVSLAGLVGRGALIAPRRTDPPRPSHPVPTWSAPRLDRLVAELRGRP